MLFLKKAIIFFVFSLVSIFSWAQSPEVINAQMNLVQQIQEGGYISESQVKEIQDKYIKTQSVVNNTKSPQDSENSSLQEKNWTQYVNWLNFIKIIAVGLILIASYGFIAKVTKKMWYLVLKVPFWLYQGIFLMLSLFCLVKPDLIWESQAFYIAVFGSFLFLAILSWMVVSYEIFFKKIFKVLSLGIPYQIVICVYLMLYFGVLAIAYQSQLFGFFSVVALSGAFGFSIVLFPYAVMLNIKEKFITPLIISHVFILVAYIAIKSSGLIPASMTYFNAGIEYYISIALGVALWIVATPYYDKRKSAAYFALSVVLCLGMSWVYFTLAITTIPMILFLFMGIILATWLFYITFTASKLLGLLSIGLLLYGVAYYFEMYGQKVIQQLSMVN